jgi:hypothetical protein
MNEAFIVPLWLSQFWMDGANCHEAFRCRELGVCGEAPTEAELRQFLAG